MRPWLQVDGLTLAYTTHDKVVRAAHRVGFDVPRGDRFVLLGASGCGKSSLLKAAGGFLTPREGTITLDGEAVRGLARTASWCSRSSTSCRRGRRCSAT